jgi:hypothetical protein
MKSAGVQMWQYNSMWLLVTSIVRAISHIHLHRHVSHHLPACSEKNQNGTKESNTVLLPPQVSDVHILPGSCASRKPILALVAEQVQA